MRSYSSEIGERRLQSPTVETLYRAAQPVLESTSCLHVLEHFLANDELYALPVVDVNDFAHTLIDRHSFVEFFSRPYIREVHGKKSIAGFLDQRPTGFKFSTPVIVETSTTIDDAAQIIIGAGIQHLISGFVVTRDEKYLGIANGHDLLNEITRRKQAELYYLAHYDQLTGIPNRMLFTDRLSQACREATRLGTLVGLMFIDIDRFKQVNDSMGHTFGDQLLRAVAERLKSCARDCDTVSRLGGDEFAILMDNLKQSDDADVFAQRIGDAMRRPFEIHGRDLIVSLSIGIAIFPRDDQDTGALLTKADAAMYAVKANGRNGYRTYIPGLSMYSLERMSLETDLRSALANEELVLHYQPQVSLSNDQVAGVEALVRWQHSTRGLLSPAHFIPIAEESGQIVAIGQWILREACLQHRSWLDRGLPPMRMAVNISALQFRQADFSSQVKDIIDETGIDPNFIELELTESIVMYDAAVVLETLQQLKQLGLRLAIDDFGTGFSSLSYLRRFPIDRLKIDQSFVRGIERMPVNESIVRAIAALAESLSLEIIAEGTETDAELALVRACNCDEAQGFRYARPLPANDFIEWLDVYRKGYVIRDFFEAESSLFSPGLQESPDEDPAEIGDANNRPWCV
jgi:diguanylate cyclase (GGDEF)-like protein